MNKCEGCGLQSESTPTKHIRLTNGSLKLCPQCLGDMNRKAPKLPLFQQGNFTLASGAKSRWKIECDALTMDDWEGLAAMAMEFLPPFRLVLGVPRGGVPLAKCLGKHARLDAGPTLVVDDVWTTGGSMKRFIEQHLSYPPQVFGLVAFARNPVEPWVTALFQMPARK
jgi:orotate phosphoribosyltransferase